MRKGRLKLANIITGYYSHKADRQADRQRDRETRRQTDRPADMRPTIWWATLLLSLHAPCDNSHNCAALEQLIYYIWWICICRSFASDCSWQRVDRQLRDRQLAYQTLWEFEWCHKVWQNSHAARLPQIVEDSKQANEMETDTASLTGYIGCCRS